MFAVCPPSISMNLRRVISNNVDDKRCFISILSRVKELKRTLEAKSTFLFLREYC